MATTEGDTADEARVTGPADHPLSTVRLVWKEDGTLKVLTPGGPIVIAQGYLRSQDPGVLISRSAQ